MYGMFPAPGVAKVTALVPFPLFGSVSGVSILYFSAPSSLPASLDSPSFASSLSSPLSFDPTSERATGFDLSWAAFSFALSPFVSEVVVTRSVAADCTSVSAKLLRFVSFSPFLALSPSPFSVITTDGTGTDAASITS